METNRLYNQDCIAGMGQIAEGSVDLAFADPPFNIGYTYDVYEDQLAAGEYLNWTRQWGAALVRTLVKNGPQNSGRIQRVTLLGYGGQVKWKQDESGLRVEMPAERLSEIGITLKVELA